MEEMKKMKEIENEKKIETYDKLEIEERWESSQMQKIGSLIEPNYGFYVHPMIFRSGVGPSNSLGCRGCWRLIEGAHFACDDKIHNYYLHEFCYNLPSRISNHALHSEHELNLLQGSSGYSAECIVCGKQCKGYRYHCFRCVGIDIDLLCAWLPSTIQTRAHHQHNSLSLISQPSIFSCDACDVELGNMTFSYMCFTCQYWVHLDCALGPPDVDLRTRISDSHPLELHEYGFNFCKLCEKQIKERCYVYGCQKCNQYSHIGCVALATLSLHTCVEASLMDHIEDLGKEIQESVLGYFDYDLDCYFESYDLIREARPHKLEILHWSHDHQDHLLKFGASTDEVPGIDRRRFECNGCKWPLMAPFYSCMKCNFFLHNECALFPMVHHTYMHNHDSSGANLKLEMISKGSRCSHCINPYSGFSYKCQECEYRFDPSCAKIRTRIWQHPSHLHDLYLLEATLKHPKKCNACGESIEKKRTAYFCSFCEFYLHIKCASLPQRSRHRFDRHELRLMFKSAENKLDEYICDICEDENRNPSLWFYGCEECDFAAHVDCVRDR